MQRFINHWQTALAAPLSAGAEQLQIPAAAAGLLSFVDGAWYKLTITNATRSAWEIVTATANDGGVLVIERAREGTDDIAWPAGSLVFIELTAQAMNDVLSQLASQALVIEQQAQAIAALTGRVAALEQGGGEPGGGNRLLDQTGNVLVDQSGNTLVYGG